MAMAHTLHHATRFLDVKTASLAHGHMVMVDTSLLACRHVSMDQITALEAEVAFAPSQVAPRKAVRGQPHTLVLAAVGGLDRQGSALPAFYRLDYTDADEIENLSFRRTQAATVELGLLATSSPS